MTEQSEESESQESSEMESEEEDYQWIPWFCSLKGNEFFTQIDAEFIQDAFNLTGIRTRRELRAPPTVFGIAPLPPRHWHIPPASHTTRLLLSL
jgi:hypothetical protein